MRVIISGLVPLVAIFFLFTSFSSNLYSVGVNTTPDKQWTKLQGFKGVVAGQQGTELDFDFSKWKQILLFSVSVLMYLIVVAEVTIV